MPEEKQINFCRLTQAQLDALPQRNLNTIYFTTDTRRIYEGKNSYSSFTGVGHIIGGYAAKVTGYDANTKKLTLGVADSTQDAVDFSKFAVGSRITINDPGESVTNEDGTEEDLRYLEAEITAIDAENSTLTIAAWVYSGTTSERTLSSSFADNVASGIIFIHIDDSERRDNATATGDKNFVTGLRSHANGSWNTVTGICSWVNGTNNYATGSNIFVKGISNIVTADSCYVLGSSNTVNEINCLVIGHMNQAKNQGQFILGGNNEIEALDAFVIGNGNNASKNARSAVISGNNNTVTGENSKTFGTQLKNHVKGATLLGCHGTLEDNPKNENSLAIAGGETNNEVITHIFYINKAIVNPLYNSEKDPENTGTDSDGEKQYIPERAFGMEYRGHLIPFTQKITVTDSQVVQLDHDQFARWVIEGVGEITVLLSNWQDGDSGEMVIDTTKQTINIPAAWITLDADITTTPGVYVLEIAQVGSNIFYGVKWPNQSGMSTGGSISDHIQIIDDYWYIDGVNTGVKATGENGAQGPAGSVNVIVSSTQPSNPTDGTIWIQETTE